MQIGVEHCLDVRVLEPNNPLRVDCPPHLRHPPAAPIDQVFFDHILGHGTEVRRIISPEVYICYKHPHRIDSTALTCR